MTSSSTTLARNLPDDDLPFLDRIGQQQLDGARALLLGQQAHADGGNDEQEEHADVLDQRL